MTGADDYLTVGIIAGEVSGDLLGADLIASLRKITHKPVKLVGVGGDALAEQGLQSLFDFSELSIMGLTAVLARLPNIIRRIGQTADALIAARPDVLIIIDSPDFTHRVARRVRKALPDIAIVNYVCPSVWAWKEHRAKDMLDYVDLVLAVLPFEPLVMQTLGGPETVYIGHRLATADSVLAVRAARANRPMPETNGEKTILLLPGSRSTEIQRLAPVFGEAASGFLARGNRARFLMPTVPRQEKTLRDMVSNWSFPVDIGTGEAFKWDAFARADAALAASGTVILELGLCGVPVVSSYISDWLVRFVTHRIKTWTGALPNLIADYPVVPEYINDVVRPGSLLRWLERLSTDTAERRAMLDGFDLVWQNMQVHIPAGEAGAAAVLRLMQGKLR
jgi:lipid-A-disaccharide synthase